MSQRYINTRFWNDSYIRELNTKGKCLFNYLITNPSSNIAGAYEIAIDLIILDTGLRRSEVLDFFTKFEADQKIVYREGWVLVINTIKYQGNSPKIKVGIANQLKAAPEWVKPLVSKICDRVSIPYTYPIDTLSHKNENENKNKNENKNSATPSEAVPATTKPKSVLPSKVNLSTDDYLIEKQLENPLLDITGLFKRFSEYCLREKKHASRQYFENWIKNEDPPLKLIPGEVMSAATHINPMTGRGFV